MEWLNNFSEGMAVEVKFDEECPNDDWFPATVLRKVQGVNSFLVACNNSSNKGKDGLTEVVVDSSHIRPPPPNLKVENFKFMEKVNAFCDSAWRLGFITKVLTKGRYSVFLKNGKRGKQEKELSHSEIRSHMDFMNGVWVNASQSIQSSACGQAVMGHVNSNAKIPKAAIQLDSSSAAKGNIEENSSCRNSGKNSMQQPTTNDIVPTLSLERENSTDLCSHACHVELMQDRHPNQESEATISTNYQLVCNELSAVSQNLDRLKNADTNREEVAADNSVEVWEIAAKLPDKRQLSLKAEYIVTGVDASDMGIEDSAAEEDKSPAGTGLESGVQGALTENSPLVSSIDYVAKEVDEAVGRTSCITSNNVQPQSLCSEGNSSDQAVKQWNDTSETERETIKEDSVINAPLANENQEMPFVKNSAIWEVVESQEVFQIMPQKPHFHPLVKHKELQREAFAIGYMVTFATLADKARQLETNSPRNVFDSYLETLDDLKTLGFKVEPVEDRINKLLSIKGKRVKLEEQSKEVEVHLAERSRDRIKLERDIGAIDEELRKLKEKRALAMSAKERKDSKLNSLRMEAGAVSVDISKARNDFEMWASAPW